MADTKESGSQSRAEVDVSRDNSTILVKRADENGNRSVEKSRYEEREESNPGCYIKARHVLAMMCFLAMFNVYTVRLGLSVAIVAMVNNTASEGINGTPTKGCPSRGGQNYTAGGTSSNGVFDWDPAQQGLLLGCFFYGYICNSVTGAWMSKRFGFKRVMGAAMLISGLLTLLMPAAARLSFELMVALRIVVGFCQGVISPSIIGVFGSWGPRLERSALTSFCLSGSSVGTFIAFPLSGVIADKFGWEAVFYTSGGGAVLWCVFWFVIVYDSPEKHPRISTQEKEFIRRNAGTIRNKKPLLKKLVQRSRDEWAMKTCFFSTFIFNEGTKVKTPWKAMLTSPPLIGILCAHFACNWGLYTLLTLLPTYMSTILKFNLTTSGIISSLPYILQWMFTVIGGFATDFVRSRHLASTIVVRKINTTLGLAVPGIFLVLAGYIGCDASGAIALLSVSAGFTALVIPGSTSNTQDIAPKYSGIIYGISSAFASVSGFLAPQVAGFLFVHENSLEQWQLVFWIAAGVYLLGTAVYLVLASSEEQPWAKGAEVEERSLTKA